MKMIHVMMTVVVLTLGLAGCQEANRPSGTIPFDKSGYATLYGNGEPYCLPHCEYCAPVCNPGWAGDGECDCCEVYFDDPDCTDTQPDPDPDPDQSGQYGKDLLVTHPSKSVLERLVLLLSLGYQGGYLSLPPGGQIVALVHETEWEDYASAEEFAGYQGATGIRFERMSCTLTEDTLFQQNDCTQKFRQLFESSAGIVFTGGPDLPPSVYGREALLTTGRAAPGRQYYELSFMYHLIGRNDGRHTPFLAERPDYPVLGICMGMQSMNVAAGGTLYQDIPSELYGIQTFEQGMRQDSERIHRNYNYGRINKPGVAWGSVHSINIESGSRLSELIAQSQSIQVISAHHQCADDIGYNLRVVARSQDGQVVEAVEHLEYPNVLGVQFHPDYKALWDPNMNWAQSHRNLNENIAMQMMNSDHISANFNKEIWSRFSQHMKGEDQDGQGCPGEQFRCGDGTCIPNSWVCDYEDDCSDGSDQADCPDDDPDTTCSADQWLCNDGQTCIPNSWLCDWYNDCPGGEDEDGC